MKKHVNTILAAVFSFGLVAAIPAGATDVTFEHDASLPLVNLNVAIKAGSVADPQGRLGLTNFMGEMLLRGTKHHTKEELNQELDALGAELAVETRSEAMILRGSVLSSQLEPFLALVKEILTEPSFPRVEIESLRSQIVSAILSEQSSDQTLEGRAFTEYLFKDHPYGNPVLGKTKTVQAITADDIRAQYGTLVNDDLLLVVGSGDATTARISDWAKDLVSKLPKSGAKVVKVDKPKNPDKRRLLIVDKPDRTQTQISGGQIGVRMTDADFFPLFLGNHAFGGGSFSARLMTEVRVKRGWSYGAYSYFKHSLQPRSWQFYLFPASKDTPQALALTLGMVDDLRKNGIKPEEFEFSKRSLVNSAGFMYNTPKKRVDNALTEKTLDLPAGFMKSYGDHLKSVSLTEVNEAFKRFLKPEDLTIVVVATAKDMKAPLAKAAGVPVEQVEVVPYNQE